MAYNKELADKIVRAARERFPEAVGNWQELQELTGVKGTEWEEWRLALEALEADGLISYDYPVRGGIDNHLHSFVGLKVTQKGRLAA
ncbi:MAG: hypothetical protein ACJ71Q_08905 [Terriglobales bacterium]